MRFTVTPLGGSGRAAARIVADIVNYLAPDDNQDRRLEPPPAGKQDRVAAESMSGQDGPARYYADGGDEPGQWGGKGARALGLAGSVERDDLARVLAGRDPRSGARLISAQGSAGRRPGLGVGTATRWGPAGGLLYDERDAAAVLGVTSTEAAGLLDAGVRLAARHLVAVLSGSTSTGDSQRPGDHAGPGTIPGADAATYLVPIIDAEGRRWVTDAELTRCEDARMTGVRPEDVIAGGSPDDLLPIGDAARIAGVTVQYLRTLARRYETNKDAIDAQLANGRQPRQAYLVAYRGPKRRWLVRRRDLADLVARRQPPAVRVGYDVTLTTEKSLSVLALLSDPDTGRAVLAAIAAGNDWSLTWLEDRAAQARIRGKAVPVDGWTVASFRHHTSRALDPFEHWHNVIANTVEAPDGTRRALDARNLYNHAQGASALATAEMRCHLTTALGVRWRPAAHGGWEIAGIPDDVNHEFSQRRNEVDDALRELEGAIGRGARPDEVEHIVLRTRPAKQHVGLDELRSDWWRRARALGFDPATLEHGVGKPTPAPPPEPQVLYRRLAAPDGICQHLSVFDEGDVLAALCDMPIPQPDGRDPQPLVVGAQRLQQLAAGFLRSPLVVKVAPGNEHSPALFTTAEMLAVQDRIVKRYRTGLRQRDAGLVPADLLAAALAHHPRLNHEQRRLVERFCRSGHRTMCAVGRAGAGKTTAMTAAATAWRSAGYRVVGTAVKGEAARILGDTTGVPTETLAWWLAHEDPHTAPLDAQTVLVVDEASTISDRDLDRLLWLAEQTGATLRLIGDPAQHSAVEAGGMFRVLCERHPAHTPQLTNSLRLRDPRDRAAADALRAGKVDEALDHLDAAGHLHIVEDELDFYRQILARWWEAHIAGLDHPMVDRRNAVRHRLNRLAQRLLQANGEIGTDEIRAAAGDRRFAVGDRVIARRPARDLHPPGQPHAYVRNGATGTIVAIDAERDDGTDTIAVDFDGIGPITLPRSYLDGDAAGEGPADVGLDLAYAVTSYAAQGATWATSTSRLDDRSRRSEAYVDITRGVHANHLYLTRAADPLDGEHLPRLPPPPVDQAVADRLRRTRGEITAWELRRRPTARMPPRAVGPLGL